MAKLAAYPEPMNVEQFQAFYDTRPDGEKWELIDGELFLNASPVRPHQKVVHAIATALELQKQATDAWWEVSPGLGIRLSEISSVEPDLMIRPDDDLRGNMCDDIIVAFEVLAPSTRRNDLEFKRLNYANLPSLAHYVAVSPEKIEVRVYSRAANWAERIYSQLGETIRFDEVAAVLPLADIYRSVTKLMVAPNS